MVLKHPLLDVDFSRSELERKAKIISDSLPTPKNKGEKTRPVKALEFVTFKSKSKDRPVETYSWTPFKPTEPEQPEAEAVQSVTVFDKNPVTDTPVEAYPNVEFDPNKEQVGVPPSKKDFYKYATKEDLLSRAVDHEAFATSFVTDLDSSIGSSGGSGWGWGSELSTPSSRDSRKSRKDSAPPSPTGDASGGGSGVREAKDSAPPAPAPSLFQRARGMATRAYSRVIGSAIDLAPPPTPDGTALEAVRTTGSKVTIEKREKVKKALLTTAKKKKIDEAKQELAKLRTEETKNRATSTRMNKVRRENAAFLRQMELADTPDIKAAVKRAFVDSSAKKSKGTPPQTPSQTPQTPSTGKKLTREEVEEVLGQLTSLDTPRADDLITQFNEYVAKNVGKVRGSEPQFQKIISDMKAEIRKANSTPVERNLGSRFARAEAKESPRGATSGGQPAAGEREKLVPQLTPQQLQTLRGRGGNIGRTARAVARDMESQAPSSPQSPPPPEPKSPKLTPLAKRVGEKYGIVDIQPGEGRQWTFGLHVFGTPDEQKDSVDQWVKRSKLQLPAGVRKSSNVWKRIQQYVEQIPEIKDLSEDVRMEVVEAVIAEVKRQSKPSPMHTRTQAPQGSQLRRRGSSNK
jgi:hypothetical protein